MGRRRWRCQSFPGAGRVVKYLCRLIVGLLQRRGADAQIDTLRNVKDGHFAVIAWDFNRPVKFFVKLKFLRHPAFLDLLEAAEQEFGLNQKGVLAIPCKASELQYILQEGKHISASKC
ncbi:hypothetical protein MLD38_035394 [Melastoma candidum]|uniref:Uncharacterized protein n=1 Tax=Melastoma candidum TaxID=119954 RepID=A0ACB9LI99_9MYRT|nr:hypothetical protein MLD38_035394 [Melastoma candidum]